MSFPKENIELIEVSSSSSTATYIKSKFKLDNKIGSSPTLSPTHSDAKSETDFSLFTKTKSPPLRPISAKLLRKNKFKKQLSDGQDTSESIQDKQDAISESVYSSKSETTSYREKFKERFDSVKKQAGSSVFKAHNFKTKTEKLRHLKRSIKIMKKENEEVDLTYKKYETTNKPVIADFISKAKAFSFFCEEAETNITVEQPLTENKGEEVLIEISQAEEHKQDIEFIPCAENLRFNIKLSENEYFWRPSREKVKLIDKLETDEPRLLSEEGLFKDSKPQISQKELNLFEHRLLSIDDKKWFNCEGELDILPSPYSPISYRRNQEVLKYLSTTYVKANIDPTLYDQNSTSANILYLSIISLQFKHHPLFSLEHVFEQKLISLYEAYMKDVNTNKLTRISRRLENLRSANRNLQSGDKINSNLEEINNLREVFFESSKANRLLLKSILETWKEIKGIRQTNGYSSTRIKLNIKKEKCNYKTEKIIWDAKIKETCEEIISEILSKYEGKIAIYRKEIEKWKVSIKSEDEDVPEKPKKPSKYYDAQEIEENVELKFAESFKPPGEPNISLILTYDNEVLDDVKNAKEKLRRNAVQLGKIHLKLLSNKTDVCKLKPASFDSNFVCSINEAFSLQLYTVPENLILEVYEQPGTMMKRKLGEIKLIIPESSVSTKVLQEEFVKKEIVHYKHEGVGSGIELKDIVANLGDLPNEVLNTLGVLNYKIRWQDANSRPQELDDSFDIKKHLLNDKNAIDINKLMKWSKENNPDPRDPKNAALFEYINNYSEDFETVLSSPMTHFRFNPDIGLLEFCDMKDIEQNPRFQFLELRNQNEPEFVGVVVSNNSKNIPQHILANYQRRINKENGGNLMSEDFILHDDDIKDKRSYGQNYLMQIYIKVFQQCRNAQNNLAYEDVVNEKVIPYIENMVKNIVSNVINWFYFVPSLKFTIPNVLRASPFRSIMLSKCTEIVIHVNWATNLPIRHINQLSQTGHTLQVEGVVKYFLIATYRHFELQTSSVEGSNLNWNEELIIPLESTNTDYMSPNSLSGTVVLKLFDEHTIQTSSEKLKIRNCLGSIEIPISAIAYTNKIEGMFKLSKPSSLFGYEQEHVSNTRKIENQDTYLALKIMLKPNVPKLSQNMADIDTTELPYMKQYILNWNETYNLQYTDRKFFSLVMDINGKSICVTRFIKALEPPQLNSDRFNVTPDQCAHYVSNIPFTDSNQFYQNIWLTTDQLLKLMIGSVIDHAIALTCYLLALDLEVWLLLGYGLPYGSTAFVLLKEYVKETNVPSYSIYDVVTATKYNITNELCPLQKIYCIVNEHNVWANVQKINKIHLIRFDLTRRSDWLPLFARQVSAPTNSIQHKLNYSVTPNIKQLEYQINKSIQKKFAKLRKQERTLWNHNLSKTFKNIMAKYETAIMEDRRKYELFLVTQNLTLSHLINGFIINLPYTSVSKIVQTILSTGVHTIPGTHTEFILTVHLYSYPNHVLNICICLLGIVKK